jgi:hypothetical protein
MDEVMGQRLQFHENVHYIYLKTVSSEVRKIPALPATQHIEDSWSQAHGSTGAGIPFPYF